MVVPTIVFIISYNILKIKQILKCFTLFHVEHYIVSDEICLRQMKLFEMENIYCEKAKGADTNACSLRLDVGVKEKDMVS